MRRNRRNIIVVRGGLREPNRAGILENTPPLSFKAVQSATLLLSATNRMYHNGLSRVTMPARPYQIDRNKTRFTELNI